MHIDLDVNIVEGTVYISEENCTGEEYSLHDKIWPEAINDVCGCLYDYLYGLDYKTTKSDQLTQVKDLVDRYRDTLHSDYSDEEYRMLYYKLLESLKKVVE